MKRDMDLIRRILLHVEEHDNLEIEVEDFDKNTISYHVRLLIEAGLMHGVAMTALDGTIILQDCGHTCLTWEGHEFLDAARQDTLWDKAKDKVGKTLGTISFSLLTELLMQLAKQPLGLP